LLVLGLVTETQKYGNFYFTGRCNVQCPVKYTSHGTAGRHQFRSYRIKTDVCKHYPCVKVKGKAVPLQAWSGPEGSRKLRFPDFMTTAQDGGKVVSLTHRPPLPPGNTPGTHFC